MYISSAIIVIAAQLWLALGKNINDSIIGHTLLGVGAAPFEALPVISVSFLTGLCYLSSKANSSKISDIFFAHERGTMMGAYVFGLSFGSFIGPICAGYMAVNHGWRMVYWLGVFISGAITLAMFLFMEETVFHRPQDLSEGRMMPGNDPTKVIEATEPSAKYPNDDNKNQESIQDVEAVVGEVFNVKKFRICSPLWKLTPCSFSTFMDKLWRPLTVVIFPAVLWGGINYGTCVAWLSILATTESGILAAPPYNFKPSALGLFFLSPLIGSLIG